MSANEDLTCASCLNGLENEEFISALNSNYHIDCFRCSACDREIWNSNFYFEKDGLLFCKDDYWAKFGECCQECNQIVSGPIMIAGDHKFHPECFCCKICHVCIGDGDSYALIDRSQLYCGQCYRRQMPSSQVHVQEFPDASLTIKKPPHSIRLVEIPWQASNKGGIRLSVDENDCDNTPFSPATASGCRGVRISDLDENPDLMALHIGDRIIEVNGQSVDDNSLEDLQKIIHDTDRVLQLTIEHEPNTITRRNPISGELEFLTSQAVSRNASSSSIAQSNSHHNVPSALNDKKQTVHLPTGMPPPKSQLSKADKERIAVRKDEGYMSGTPKTKKLQRKTKNFNCNQSSNSLREKERSSSMSKLLDEHHHGGATEMYDLSRTKSFRVEPKQTQQRIFRASDLVQGELLGKGFFGQVYKVTHKETKEVMVLKELYRVDEIAQKNFLKEVAVLRSLSHKNVLRFIGVLYKEKKLHLITEYIAGGSLKELIHDSGLPLTWQDRISFARDISSGMSYLHSKNIIHRDLNSLNCLVREDRSVVVADFGLARIVNPDSGHGMNSERWLQDGKETVQRKDRQRRKRYTVVGTPWYMAPEMMKGNKYDEKVDVFSFGIIVCEIIGRVEADPDYLPRNNDFGLNQQIFKEKFCLSCGCPVPFYKVAFLCCDLNPDKRPSFEILEDWFNGLTLHISMGLPLDLISDIDNFKGNQSLPTTPEIITLQPTISKKPSFVADVFKKPTTPPIIKELSIESCDVIDANVKKTKSPQSSPPPPIPKLENLKIETKDKFIGTIRKKVELTALTPPNCLLPRSPHLSKDFSPNGDRIRDSLRARRKQKILLNREKTRKSLEMNGGTAGTPTNEEQPKKCNEVLNKKPGDARFTVNKL